MPNELHPFRYRDPLMRKWVRARYVAELDVIAKRYKEWEVTGPPEIREPLEPEYFNPFRSTRPPPPAGNLDQEPTLCSAER